FLPRTGLMTKLPDSRVNTELRDEIKSLLRGVWNFEPPTGVTDQSQWYPNPATPTPNATLNGSAIKFGIYNLDPYVWFVHTVLKQNGYGFSLDDDVSNASAKSSDLQIAFGGNEYTAPLNSTQTFRPQLKNLEGFTGGAPFGTFSTSSYPSL